MLRWTDVVAVGILLMGVWPVHASELLSTCSYDAGADGAVGDHGFAAVKFYLDFSAVGEYRLGIAESPYWHEGESGVFDFQPNVSNWAAFMSRATDGVNEYIYAEHRFEPVGVGGAGGGTGWRESQFFGRPADLFGCDVDFVRLIVGNVHMWAEDSWFYLNADVTWQFWGAVPEPTAALLLAALAGVIRRR